MEEQWKPVVGWERRYEVSSTGRLRSLTGKRKILTPNPNKHGYPFYCLFDGDYRRNGRMVGKCIHRMMAEAFLPNPDNKPSVAHLNDIRSDNRIENLMWVTVAENQRQMVENGHSNKGTMRYNSVMDDDIVRTIRKLREDGHTYTTIAKFLGVRKDSAQQIGNRTAWKHIQ